MVVREQRLSESAGVRSNSLFIRKKEFSAWLFWHPAHGDHPCRHYFGRLDLVLSASKSLFYEETEEPTLVFHVPEGFTVIDASKVFPDFLGIYPFRLN